MKSWILKKNSESSQSNLESLKESFRIYYFLYIVDQAVGLIKRKFEHYNTCEETFGFLFSIKRLESFSNQDLKLCCKHLETHLKHYSSYDLDGKILSEEFIKVIT